MKPDATDEVAVEDILLEVYAEEPPPPMSRRPAVPAPPPPPRVAIAAAIASVVPPPPNAAESAAVDALLRASDPAFAPFVPPVTMPPRGRAYVPAAPYGYGVGPDFETPSVAPVMLATTHPPVIERARPMVGSQRTSRGAAVAVWSLVVLVLAVASGAGIFFGMRSGLFARFQAKAAPVAASPANAPVPGPSAASLAPAPPAPAPPMPTVSIDALPKSPVPPDATLVTFPAYAHGHRVFVDGRVIAVAEDGPTKIKCGRHMFKIGSARKPRVIDLACGSEVTVP